VGQRRGARAIEMGSGGGGGAIRSGRTEGERPVDMFEKEHVRNW
jgi:hypothetical protein